eukprot:6253046-Pyramimonas_sp.AAC.1
MMIPDLRPLLELPIRKFARLPRVMGKRHFDWAAHLREPMRSSSAAVETAPGPVLPCLGALRLCNCRACTAFINDALRVRLEVGVTKVAQASLEECLCLNVELPE